MPGDGRGLDLGRKKGEGGGIAQWFFQHVIKAAKRRVVGVCGHVDNHTVCWRRRTTKILGSICRSCKVKWICNAVIFSDSWCVAQHALAEIRCVRVTVNKAQEYQVIVNKAHEHQVPVNTKHKKTHSVLCTPSCQRREFGNEWRSEGRRFR